MNTDKEAMSAIESAIVGEKAASLGHAGYLLQKALAVLDAAGDDPNREELVLPLPSVHGPILLSASYVGCAIKAKW